MTIKKRLGFVLHLIGVFAAIFASEVLVEGLTYGCICSETPFDNSTEVCNYVRKQYE